MRVSAAGVYRIRPDFGAWRDALRCHGDRDHVRRELGCLVLVGLEVREASGRLELESVHQPGNPNVPYDERYFSLDRRRRLGSGFEHPAEPDFALAFYLHAFEIDKPLLGPWGTLDLPSPCGIGRRTFVAYAICTTIEVAQLGMGYRT